MTQLFKSYVSCKLLSAKFDSVANHGDKMQYDLKACYILLIY